MNDGSAGKSPALLSFDDIALVQPLVVKSAATFAGRIRPRSVTIQMAGNPKREEHRNQRDVADARSGLGDHRPVGAAAGRWERG